MDKKELYQKSEKIINEALEAVKHSVKVLSQKAGEAAHVTKLLIEKATLEHQVTKCFSQLGHKVYERAVRQGESIDLQDPEIQKILDETKKLDASLAQVGATLEIERKAQTGVKPKTVRKRTSKN